VDSESARFARRTSRHWSSACLSQRTLLILFGLFAGSASAQTVGKCGFSRETMQFEGLAQQQAACLLRHVAKYGKVSSKPAALPAGLANAIGKPVRIERDKVREHLSALGVSENQVGGSLDAGLSHGNGGSPAAAPVRYFVIHDTSTPWLGDAKQFPSDEAPSINGLSSFGGANAVAHVFVNRLGVTLLGHDFSVPWRATKLETKAIGTPAKGLFLHVELLQPRRRDPAGGAKNDAIAPEPGFTKSQYDTLALLYLAASLRRGEWLIPGFHPAIDDGLADAHDDPQNFSLDAFGSAVDTLRKALGDEASTSSK
jgi:hypothetical protein